MPKVAFPSANCHGYCNEFVPFFRLHDASEQRKKAEQPKQISTSEAEKVKLSGPFFGEGKKNYEEGKKFFREGIIIFEESISRGEEGKISD